MATPEDLQAMLHRDDQEASIESIATQLMTLHPSALVQQTGEAFIHALEEKRERQARDFAAKANTLLTETRTAVTHARQASDLDQVLRELHGLAGPQVGSFVTDAASQELVAQLNLALQFVSSWQDYLSASATGKTDQAHEALERILNNTQLDALNYFPRSEILARRDGSPAAPASTQSPADQADDLLAKIKTVDDVSAIMNQINRIPNQPINLSALRTLEQARDDVTAGLPVTLDVKSDMAGNYFGDNLSRITALEFLAILPSYFDTERSDPPKPGETLSGYLDRLAASADAAGNLALLQRVLAVRIAITRGHSESLGTASEVFLAGLSQEAAGQYAQAVVTYEKALKNFDPLVPVKIVGDRLATIKAAHPDEFNAGMTTFLTPEPPPDPRLPPGWLPNRFPHPDLVSVLPIPMTLSIPAHTTAHAAPVGTAPKSN